MQRKKSLLARISRRSMTVNCAFVAQCMMASLLALPITSMSATVYKWTDENGVVHYGDKKPETADVKTLKVSGGKPRTSSSSTAPSQDTQTNPEKDLAAEHKKEEKKITEENCKKASAQIKTLTTYSRVRVNENGKLRYLSEEEKQKQVQQMQDYVSKNCQ